MTYQLTPARLIEDGARFQALFASSLQRSDVPGADVVAEAISAAIQQLGTRGCVGRMAQEFGDHPEAAAERMRWVRSLLSCPKAITAVAWPDAEDGSGETEPGDALEEDVRWPQ